MSLFLWIYQGTWLSPSVRFPHEMLCKLGNFQPLVFSLRGAWLKITCWLLFLGGKKPYKIDMFRLYGLHSNFTQQGEEWWLLADLNLYRPAALLAIALILCSEKLNLGYLWVGRLGHRMLSKGWRSPLGLHEQKLGPTLSMLGHHLS